MHALGAARLREGSEPERIERLLDDERHLNDLAKSDVRGRIEVEEDEVGTVGLVDSRVPRVHVDAAHVGHPDQGVLVVDQRRVDPALPRRPLPRRDLHVEARDPLRHSLRRVLLKERLAVRAVGVAPHRERAIAQMRHEDVGDRAVVVDQVALRDLLLGPEDLVEVGELHLSFLRLGRALAPHVLRRLVVTEPLEGRRAQVAVVRPLRELDLGHELRLDPDDVALLHLRHLRDDREGRLVPPERLELLEQLADRALVEAGADVSDPLPLLAAMDAEHERTEAAAAPALALRVAADHELLPPVRLDLQPVATAAAFGVARRRALRHHALQTLFGRRLEQRLAVFERAGELDDRIRHEQLLEPGPALGQWEVDRRVAVDLEHVEHFVRKPSAPLLHRREARPAVRVERHDLAVDDRVGRSQRLGELLRYDRESLRQVVAPARDELGLAAAYVREGPVAVPFRLVLPALATGQLLRQRREHRAVDAAAGRWCALLALAEDEPVLLVAGEVRRHERPRPLETLAVQAHSEAAVPLLFEQLVRAAIPDFDRARAVVPLRDLALEAPVLEWMVFDVDGEVLLAGLKRDALRHGPRGEGAVALETEVVMEPSGVMSLDDEDRRLRLAALAPERLRRLLAISLALVLRELLAHAVFLLPRARCVRSTDSRSACIRSMTCGSSSDGSGSGCPSALERMSSSSSERYVSSYRSGSNFALRFSTRDFAISTSALRSPFSAATSPPTSAGRRTSSA